MTAIRFRIIFFQPLRNCVKLSVRLLARNARFKKCVAFDPTRTPIFQLVTGVECLLHGNRHPKTEVISDEGAVKFFRRDADDRVLNPVEILRSADDIRIATVTILPGLITDHGHWMRVATFTFLGPEPAPQNRFYSERVEIICRDNCARRAFSAIADAQRRAHNSIDDERLKERGILFVIEEFGIRQPSESIFTARCGVQREHAVLVYDQRIGAN